MFNGLVFWMDSFFNFGFYPLLPLHCKLSLGVNCVIFFNFTFALNQKLEFQKIRVRARIDFISKLLPTDHVLR